MKDELDKDDYPFAFGFESLMHQARMQMLKDNDKFLSARMMSRLMNEFLPDDHTMHESGVEVNRWLNGKSVPTFERCAAIQLVMRHKFDLDFDLDVMWALATYQYLNDDQIRGILKYHRMVQDKEELL